MNATKEELINFLEKEVLTPTESNQNATEIVKKKVRATRIRLNQLKSAEKVRVYFWSAMATDRGIDSYNKIKDAGGRTFEDVRKEFKTLCGD